MQAWVVDRPGPVRRDTIRWCASSRPVPEPGPGEVRVRVRACGVCRTDLHLTEGDLAPRRPRVTPGPRDRRRGRPAGRREHAVAVRATASGCPGWPTPAGPAASASPAARTCASTRASPAGTSTAATRRTPWWTRPTPTRCPRASTTWRWRRCSAPASSATAPCGGPTCPTGAGSASTGSAAPPTSRPRWHWPGVPASMS